MHTPTRLKHSANALGDLTSETKERKKERLKLYGDYRFFQSQNWQIHGLVLRGSF